MPGQDRIARTLREQGAAIKETVPPQTPQLLQLAERVTGTFQHGGRLLVCGSGSMAPIADLVAHVFRHRLAVERPSLPALSLGHDPHLATALARDGQQRFYFARQLRVLATEGDVLLVFAEQQPDPAVHEAIIAAQQLGCFVAVLAPAKADFGAAAPNLLLRLEAETPPRAVELALTLGHLLCELVEADLFGL